MCCYISETQRISWCIQITQWQKIMQFSLKVCNRFQWRYVHFHFVRTVINFCPVLCFMVKIHFILLVQNNVEKSKKSNTNIPAGILANTRQLLHKAFNILSLKRCLHFALFFDRKLYILIHISLWFTTMYFYKAFIYRIKSFKVQLPGDCVSQLVYIAILACTDPCHMERWDCHCYIGNIFQMQPVCIDPGDILRCRS